MNYIKKLIFLFVFILIILLSFLIYNNNRIIENYTPKSYPNAINITLCQEENMNEIISNSVINSISDPIIADFEQINPEELKNFNKDFDLNLLKEIKNNIKTINFYESQELKSLPRIKTYIEDPFYKAHNLENIDQHELVTSDYSIINNIKLEENQAYVPRNHTFHM